MSTPPALAPTVLLGSPEYSRLVLELPPARPTPAERAPAPDPQTATPARRIAPRAA